MAIMIEKSPGPSIAAMPMAMRSPGMESMMSIRRMITLSVLPPKNPDIEPSRSPIDTPTLTATTPMRSEKRAP